MDCNSARHTFRKLHAPMVTMVYIGEREEEDALEHASVCDSCKMWFKEELCARLKKQAEGNSLTEDVLVRHGMTHEALEMDCPTFDDEGNLRP